MKQHSFVIALMLALTPQLALAAEPPCITAKEFSAIASYGLPSVINGAKARCSATLPTDAFLRVKGEELSKRYATQKAVSWVDAKNAFLKLSTATNPQAADLIKSMPDASLQPMADAIIEGMVGQQLPTERCGLVDKMVRLLSPLPAENTAELIAVVAGLGAKSGRAKLGAITLCSAQ